MLLREVRESSQAVADLRTAVAGRVESVRQELEHRVVVVHHEDVFWLVSQGLGLPVIDPVGPHIGSFPANLVRDELDCVYADRVGKQARHAMTQIQP